MRFFATCAAGTELALKAELYELRMYKVRADRGGVRFEGELAHAMRACLWSRIAGRILLEVGRFECPDEHALYEHVRELEWERWLDPRRTLAVSAASKHDALNHTNYIAQKTKDAIVDRLRDRFGERPDVDRRDPDVAVFVHLSRTEAAIYLDASGDSLHLRGYRTLVGEAPLKETLAAALLRMSEWDRQRPLIDPCCGSGTIAIEADLWSRDVAPNLARERFGFERWTSHDETAARTIDSLRAEARDRILREGADVRGSDIDPETLRAAEANARRARSTVHFRAARLSSIMPSRPPGLVISNLPYGERVDATGIWDELAIALRQLSQHRVSLLLGAPPPGGLLPAHASYARLWNGPIECRLATFEVP